MDTLTAQDLRQLSNHAMFVRYTVAHRGVLIEDDHGLWDIWPVDRWDDAVEAERRPGTELATKLAGSQFRTSPSWARATAPIDDRTGEPDPTM